MAATVAVLGSALTTTAGNKTVTATPTVGDLIVIITASTGVATTIADNGTGGTYTQVDSTRTGFSTSGNLQMWVRNNIVASAASTIYTATQTSSTGGGLVVLSVTGVTATGASAVRSSGGQSTGTAGTTPAPVLSLTPLSTNLIISAVANASNSTTTQVQRVGYTEDFDNGYNTPPTGLEVAHLLSGETSATLTQNGTSATAFASSAIELIVNQPPTAALNTPADTATGVSTTPDLAFTGTDADSDTIEYEVQVDTVNTFDSVAGTPGSVSSYYINGSTVSPVAPDGIWSSITEAFNGDTTTGATYAAINGAGSASSKYLRAGGTTATNLGGSVTQVRARVYTSATAVTSQTVAADIYTSGLAELLGTPTRNTVAINSGAYGSYTTLSAPTGGWSWSVVQALETKIYLTVGGSGSAGVYIVELEVTYTPGTPLLDKLSVTPDATFTDVTNGAHTHPFPSGEQVKYTVQAGDILTGSTQYFWRVRGKDPSGTNTFGAWATTRSFTTASGVSTLPLPVIKLQAVNRSGTF